MFFGGTGPSSSSPLQKLNLGKSRITDKTLLRMRFLGQLTEINLQWCHGVTDRGVSSLVAHSPGLRHIDLQSCTAITDESVRLIATSCGQLRHLNLSWCPAIGTAGLRHFVSPAQEHREWPAAAAVGAVTQVPSPFFESLSLVWCAQVDDSTLQVLCGVPSLRSVDLVGCAAVTEAGTRLLDDRKIRWVM